MRNRALSVLLFVFLFSICIKTEGQEAHSIVESVAKKFRLVHDYQADAVIHTDIPFIKILPVRATIYFEKPDYFRVKAKGIAILPKQGFDQMLHVLSDSTDYTSVFQGVSMENGKPLALINLIPLVDSVDLVLAKLWIDTTAKLLMKAQLTTKSNGTILSEYRYGSEAEYALPDSVVFTIDTHKFKIPRAVAADINNNSAPEAEKGKENKKGRIHVRFEHYILNKGIPKEIFKEKKEESEK